MTTGQHAAPDSNRSTPIMFCYRFLPLALLIPTADGHLHFRAAPDTELRTTISLQSSMEVVGGLSTTEMGEEPMPEGTSLELTDEITLSYVDRFPTAVDAEEGWASERTLESAGRSFTFGSEDPNGPEGTTEATFVSESALEGVALNFATDEDGELSVDCVDEDDADDIEREWLEALDADLYALCVLPAGELEAGRTWTVDAADADALLFPGGRLAWPEWELDSFDGDSRMGGMGEALTVVFLALSALETSETSGEWSFEATEVSDDEATIAITGEIELAGPDGDLLAGLLDELQEDAETEIPMTVGLEDVDGEHQLVITGALVWNRAQNRLASLELEGEAESEAMISIGMSFGEMEMNQTLEFELEGDWGLEVTVE
jgi:hypothetical protein